MSEKNWLLRLLIISILAGIPLIKSHQVLSEPNRSDTGGTYIYSSPPSFTSGSTSTSGTSETSGTSSSQTAGATFTQIYNQASSLSQQLNQAVEQVATSEAAPQQTRHFGRTESSDSSEEARRFGRSQAQAKECISPAVRELRRTIEQTEKFVQEVNTPQPNSGNSSAW